MKKLRIISIALLTVVFLVGFVIYASGQDKPKTKKTDVAVQTVKKHSHEEGSAACKEKHAKGECKGHKPGQPHHMEKGGNPSHGHAEGSAECKEKHAKDECKGHEPGQPHHMKKGVNPGYGHAEGSTECKEKHAKGECKGHKPGQPHKHGEKNKKISRLATQQVPKGQGEGCFNLLLFYCIFCDT